MIANNSLAKLSELVDLGPLNESINVVFGPAAEHIAITDFFESEEAGILSYTMVLGIKQSILFSVPGLPAIQLGIVNDSPDEWPLILCEVVVTGAAPSLTVQHFPLRVIIDNPLLVPIPPEDEADALEGFSFEVEGSFSVSADLILRAELESFSLPPFTITGTGLILGLQDCQLITHSDDVNEDIEALGFDQNFRGFYAQSAQFYWDIPFLLNGSDLPGIRAVLENIAVGNQGVSVTASLNWLVAFDGNNIDAAESEIYGELFAPDWQCALEKLEVVIERNIPIGTSGVGYLRVPYFEQLVKIELGYQYLSPSGYQFKLAISQLAEQSLNISLGDPNYQLQIRDFQLSGQFNSEGEFSLQGQAGLTLELPGLSVVAESVQIKFEHTDQQDNLLIKLDNVQVDGYGQIDTAQLVMVMLKDEEENYQLALLELISEVQWQDVSSRIALDDSAALLPMPPDDGLVNLNLSWSEEVVNFSIKAELDDVDKLWRFIPEGMRPEIDNASIDMQLTSSNGDFSGELGVEFLLRLPDFTQMEALQVAGLSEFIEVDSGDEDGWMQLRFSAELDSTEDQSAGKISASIENPVSIALQLPGLLLPEPPIVIDINKISLELSADGEELTGVLKFEGDFELYPILPENLDGFVPPMIAMQLDRLLSIAKQLELSGSASMTLGISNDNAYFQAKCIFDQAALELDLFDMLSNTLVGSANLFGNGQGNEIDLDIEVSVQLQEIYLQIGSEQPSDSQIIPFAFGFNTLLNFANVIDFPFEFSLTQDSLSFGLSELSIPLAIPQLPLSLADLNQLKDTDGNWNVQNNWQNNLLPALETEITQKSEELDEAQALLAALLENTSAEQAQIFQLEYREIPKIQAVLFDLAGRKFLFEAILLVFQNLDVNSRSIYQQYVETYQAAVDSALGWISVDTQLRFEIEDAKFVLPFNDPSDIRVEGKASIGGVDPSSVLAPLADLSFTLGISADAIYFAVEGGADPIPLPDFGRYPGSAVNIDKILIGYGYSKNSFKVDFAGELILSEQLIEDVDTSADLGFGIRLPNNSKLGFKLDLIPVVLGEVDFVIPLVAFDIDLTSDFPPPAPAIVDGQCNPAWDGLQLIIPGLVRADLKKFKFSPFFGPVPAANAEYAYDLDIGNKDLGLQHIADYRIIMPIMGVLRIPFLMDGAPFFQRMCTNIQLGGFGLSFDLTRPFPQPSPLVIFELLGFISDPNAPIDPNGHIANLMYAELYHGKISLPPPVLAMFPALGKVVETNYSGKINVATVIAMGQNIQALANDLINRLENNTQQALNWLEDTIQNPPLANVANLLALIPVEMRVIHLQGRLVFFDADATFILALASDINQQLGEPETPVPEPPQAYELVYQDDFNQEDLSPWKSYNYGLKGGQGHWYVKGGQLVQDKNVGDNSPARYGAMLVYDNVEVGDFRLFLQTKSTDDDGLGVVFYLQGKDSFYRFRMTQQQNEWRLDKLIKGDIDTLFSTKSAFTQNLQYKIRIDVSSKDLNRRSLGLLKHTPFSKNRPSKLAALTSVKYAKAKQTRIKVWVNEQLWCDVFDNVNPLTSGNVGLDSWWNNGAHFDNFELFKPAETNITLNSNLTTRQLVPLNHRLASPENELADFFAGFSAQDISAALTDSGEFAVTMTASIKAFDQNLLSMLGSINSDGRFSLLSAAQVKPFSLTVLGINIPIPFEAAARISLVGQQAGANSFARLNASIFADWIILPGATPEQAIARLLLGTQETPIALLMNSSAEFSVKGQGELRLFAEQLIIVGAVDISHAHVMIAGELEFCPDIEIAGQKVVEFTATTQGRIGPSDFVELLGAGQINLFGKSLIASDIKVGNQLIELAVTSAIFGHDNSWLINGLPIVNAQMALSGRIDFSRQTPVIALQGKGNFELFGAGIRGNVQLEVQGTNWLLAAQGNLSWLGRDWLAASILLSNTGVNLEGRADFAIPLTANQVGTGLQIAGLFLNAAVSGKFKLNNQGQLVHWDLTLDWQLAVQLPGVDNNQQSLPIASHQIKVRGDHGGSEDLFNIGELFDFNGFTLFDLQGLTIPVPQFDRSQNYKVYSHNFLGIIPVPIISDEPPNEGDDPLFEVPILTTGSVPLGKFRLDDHFNLKLAWQAGQLGVSTTVAGTPYFYPFEALLEQITD